MAYRDNSMVPSRHFGWNRFAATGIPAYTDPQPAMSGTAVPNETEADVVTGGGTIIITLQSGKWVPSGTLFDAQRQAIIDALDSAQSEAAGWNVEVRDKAAVTDVARTSDTKVTFTIPASAAYAITADEVLTFTPPREAIEGHVLTPAVAEFTTIAAA